jgi:hypothetical protein
MLPLITHLQDAVRLGTERRNSRHFGAGKSDQIWSSLLTHIATSERQDWQEIDWVWSPREYL